LGEHLNAYSITNYEAYNTAFNTGAFVHLSKVQYNIEAEALVMTHAGFLTYEGAAGSPANIATLCWGDNAGLPTHEISAFRIAAAVLGGYDQVDPGNWKSGFVANGSDVIPRALRWVKLVPTSAHVLGLAASEGSDYHSLTGRDALILDALGYQDSLIRYFLPRQR
jgi:hypothetical protein